MPHPQPPTAATSTVKTEGTAASTMVVEGVEDQGNNATAGGGTYTASAASTDHTKEDNKSRGVVDPGAAAAQGTPPSHNNTAYGEMLDAKDVQNRPLSIPISTGTKATPGAGAATTGANAGRQNQEDDDDDEDDDYNSNNNGNAAYYGNSSYDNDDDDPSPPPVEAVPITSIYQQVASAELVVDDHRRPTSPPGQIPKPPNEGPASTSLGCNGANNSHTNGGTHVPDESEEAKIERMRLQRQRFKLAKLAILLCILVVVITVPLVIRNQRLNSNSSSSSPAGDGASPPCFPSYEELESAVDDYLAGGTRKTKATTNWGNPIGIWCVSQLPDGSGMDKLFSAVRNPNAATFNEPLYYWDVQNVVSMNYMFENATMFTQPLDMWNVGKVEQMTGMFLGATNFRQNLCPWTSILSDFTLVHNMFAGTSCDTTQDPVLQGSSTLSFCTPCS